MTKREVREEMRRMEGDPELRERRRQVQRRLGSQTMMQDLESADVVLTSPLRFACAVRADERSAAAPRVVAKGRDGLAVRIETRARAAGVPIVEESRLGRREHLHGLVGTD